MTVHKLSAGDGYTYLTRQVASADERRARGQSLADYYTARGNPPGVWMGKGAADLGVVGSEVSESQMRALFGRGMHPDGESKLGVAYPDYADLAPYADRVAARVAEFEAVNGRPPSHRDLNRAVFEQPGVAGPELAHALELLRALRAASWDTTVAVSTES